MKAPRKTKLYTIEWIVGGRVVDELNLNNPRPIAVTLWWIKQLKATTHTYGNLRHKLVE